MIRKAVFPVAGMGTRFLPATKTVPKELLPVYDRPAIEHVVREAVGAGITDILFVTAPGKHSVEEYFGPVPGLEAHLAEVGKPDLLDVVRETSNLARIRTVVQEEPLGLGHAVLCAAEFVDQDPFIVFLPDDLIHVESGPNASAQMIAIHQEQGGSVIALEAVPEDLVSRYGVIAGDRMTYPEGLHRITKLVEKPPREAAPSNLAIVGRYIFTNGIIDALRSTRPGRGGEIQLTDAVEILMRRESVYGYEFRGRRYDTGTPAGWFEAVVETALRSDEAPAIKRYLSRILETF